MQYVSDRWMVKAWKVAMQKLLLTLVRFFRNQLASTAHGHPGNRLLSLATAATSDHSGGNKMDIGALASSLTTALVPLLPYLLKAGEKAAEETGKTVAGQSWEWAKSLWTKLKPSLHSVEQCQITVQF